MNKKEELERIGECMDVLFSIEFNEFKNVLKHKEWGRIKRFFLEHEITKFEEAIAKNFFSRGLVNANKLHKLFKE